MSGFNFSNIQGVEDLYTRYQVNPESVDPSWRYFFQGVDFTKLGVKDSSECRIFCLVQAYRRHGHLLAKINPIASAPRSIKELKLETLGFSSEEMSQNFPTLGFCGKKVAPLQEIIESLRQIYCSRIGFEYMDLGVDGLEEWMQARIEPKLSMPFKKEEKHFILENLNRSEVFERFIHTKYPGQTRFSLEGLETLIPMLSDLIQTVRGIDGFVIGMAHRGRLNVLTNILQKPYHVLFKAFEDVIPYLEGESGDVKYHEGFSCDINGVHVHLTPNSSALESVDGIVLGQTKAKQDEGQRFCALLIHGDAALSGQGVIYETLQMSQVDGFSTGGTIHIATNNQIGYTTLPSEGRSTRYCTDIAKTFSLPVFHVNVEDPESCVFAMRLALEFRNTFQRDVFIDLNGYRKYGHNEGDEPSFTQPAEYKIIRSKRSVRQIYLESLLAEGFAIHEMAENLEKEFLQLLNAAFVDTQPVELHDRFGSSWKKQPENSACVTKVNVEVLEEVIATYTKIPAGFHLHPKLEKWLEQRKKQIDWGTAECLAFGSILNQGKAIRISGQDAKRGTFSHRHAVWFDQKNGATHSPFSQFKSRFDVYNSILSEYGVLSFELGYSWGSPETLVIWEAQYGDFDDGAQIAIDQYIVSAEQKWARYSSLVLLLPHAYEGAGPEHSSARPERFLQLAANNNIQVVYPTTPAQMFHLLRRQAFCKPKKPLIVLTPKSLLRLPACTSSLKDFTEGEFQEFIVDHKPSKKVVICSGKMYYELPDVITIRIEQLYPFDSEKFKEIVSKYKDISCWVYVQEEPENMGAWEFLQPHLSAILPTIQFIGRPRSASPSSGSRKKHMEEQAQILASLKAIQ